MTPYVGPSSGMRTTVCSTSAGTGSSTRCSPTSSLG